MVTKCDFGRTPISHPRPPPPPTIVVMASPPLPQGSLGLRWSIWLQGMNTDGIANAIDNMLKACPQVIELGYDRWATILRSGAL